MIAKIKTNPVLAIMLAMIILSIIFVSCKNKSDSTASGKKESIIAENKQDKETKLDVSKDELEKMNIFLSAFTQVYLTNFDVNTITPEQLIAFGIRHNYLNVVNCFQHPSEDSEHGNILLEDKYVTESVKKYFDIDFKAHGTVSEENGRGFHYDGKYYIFWAADGAGYPMARIKEVFENRSGQLGMTGEIYCYIFDDEDYVEKSEATFEAYAKPHKYAGEDTWSIISFKSKIIE